MDTASPGLSARGEGTPLPPPPPARRGGLGPCRRFCKRAGDLLLSSLLLLLLSPLFLLLSLVVRAYDGGPAIFSQTRLTQGGRPFTLYKFRSLRVGGEGGGWLVEPDDHRVTAPGRFLRRCHMDELPQLCNVLRGEMSLVGPRPERPEAYAALAEELPQFQERLRVKAGITGYAQVYGAYDTAYGEKLGMDLYYIENASLRLDLALLLKTLGKVAGELLLGRP